MLFETQTKSIIIELLGECGDASVIPALTEISASNPYPEIRDEAVLAIQRIERQVKEG